ncbi:unnamed protein product [Prorocentrum cordatum]|uniref:Uncharacterized protein n=1 Tax=Prorocentrum cordatum TaxID=2364126 RepID=A0ABN9TWI6_9DINO|nr:unnamed protein product [Polarella glacialis]
MLLRSIWDSQQSDYFMEGRKVKENGAGVGEVGKSRRQEDKGEREEALQGSPPYYGSVPFGIYLQSLSVVVRYSGEPSTAGKERSLPLGTSEDEEDSGTKCYSEREAPAHLQ